MNARGLRIAGPAILVLAAVIGAVVALAYGGGAAPTALRDMGPYVRWGLPLAQLTINLSIAGLLGSLVVALFALKPGTKAFDRALDLASASSGIFTVSAAVTAYLTFLNVFTPQVSLEESFGAELGRFLTDNEVGVAWLVTVMAAAAITIVTFVVRTWTPTLLVAIAAVAATLPMASQGHAGDQANHTIAVTSIAMHIIGASVWVGGLLLLVVVRSSLAKGFPDALRRYSSVALVAFWVVALSGVVRAWVGLGSFEALSSAYGVLVIVKTLLLIGLGIAGALYRARLIAQVAKGKASAFWWVVMAELLLMGLASGVAAGLARTPPPTGVLPALVRTPAERLTGSSLPPELTFGRLFTEWHVDLLWLTVAAGAVMFYVWGVLRLKARGDSWPLGRTVSWILGMILLAWVTCGGINRYQEYMFSIHMLGHMLLTMAIPLMLVFGAPVTLASRAIHKRSDGTRGGREWILWAVHSPFARVVTHPLVAAGIYVASLWVFYFTDLFRWAVYEHMGHIWMTAHFLISGYLFAQSLVGIDPVPRRLPYPGRLVTLIAAAAMHAFFGVALMMQKGLMLAEWYGSMARPWGPTPLADQMTGAGIAWSVGEIPTLVLAIVLSVQWSSSDERTQRRRDRHADRTGDAELAEYNAKLQRIANRDAREESAATRSGSPS